MGWRAACRAVAAARSLGKVGLETGGDTAELNVIQSAGADMQVGRANSHSRTGAAHH